MKYLLLVTLLIITSQCKCKNNIEPVDTVQHCIAEYHNELQEYVYINVEIYPDYPNGIPSLMNSVYRAIDYNKLGITKEEAISQTHIPICFIVGADGIPRLFRIKGKTPQQYTLLEKEVINILESFNMKWSAARCKEKSVACETYINFRFDYR